MVDEVKALLEKATPGEWFRSSVPQYRIEGRRMIITEERTVTNEVCAGRRDLPTADHVAVARLDADAALIAAAPTIARAYLDTAAELVAERERSARMARVLEALADGCDDEDAGECAALDHVYGVFNAGRDVLAKIDDLSALAEELRALAGVTP